MRDYEKANNLYSEKKGKKIYKCDDDDNYWGYWGLIFILINNNNEQDFDYLKIYMYVNLNLINLK